ncbi:hypothetical protein QMZ92_07735 [Streptomyces sp. HNM0645]|uniref:hypothetical protein n=1 Tax=Streptomyces sp. HNM0645 TaxID=2782343 RepID=UPI0024B7DCFA|nr:hypothetical protein [Streptomyces sp. HNM0645]MDI9884291.1 hypothetical protein [Streptomyces sp. HNM0645]
MRVAEPSGTAEQRGAGSGQTSRPVSGGQRDDSQGEPQSVPQNPNRGTDPPPAPSRPVPTPEWSDAVWQPGDPVEER